MDESLDAGMVAEEIGKEPTDTAPRKRRGRPPGSKNRPKTGTAGITEIRDGVESLVTMVGIGVTWFNAYDGAVILDGSRNFASAVSKLAETNPSIHRALSKMIETSAWAAVASAAMPMALSIGANHGIFPPLFLKTDVGVKPTLGNKPSDNGNGDSTEPGDGGSISSIFDILNSNMANDDPNLT